MATGITAGTTFTLLGALPATSRLPQCRTPREVFDDPNSSDDARLIAECFLAIEERFSTPAVVMPDTD